ncbi:hypothetical protein WIS52_29820 [Pseudonocardia nematodicida]|uniref:Uncharacterized protein n=1 Tax=Pseudonocardia nematodicida TaxID=1206997 RepID=A0ABV1KJP3_9PSEU
MNRDRALWWTIGALHLVAAAGALFVGVPVATPVALALVGCAALGLGAVQRERPAKPAVASRSSGAPKARRTLGALRGTGHAPDRERS